MFYVLDFHSHRFTTCETVEEVNEKLKQLQDSGVAEDEISVINRLVDDCEMSINEVAYSGGINLHAATAERGKEK